MTREFPDELLSAYLDGELSPADRAQVERHLANNEADRSLLSELQALRSEVAALPPAAISSDFADRVVQAADRLVAQRLLLPEDRDEVIAEAEANADLYPECVPSH